MNQNMSKSRRRRAKVDNDPLLSTFELAKLGQGEVAYIKMMTSDEAQKAFPAIEGLPTGISLYALHGADGTPLDGPFAVGCPQRAHGCAPGRSGATADAGDLTDSTV